MTSTTVTELSVSLKSTLTCSRIRTQLSRFAGFRACSCLEGFYRLERFGACVPCPPSGLNCENESVTLATGFYWQWKLPQYRLLYENLTRNLQIFNNSYDRRYISYNLSFPQVYDCPFAASCLGGMKADCTNGYEGPLCAVCSKGYYRLISSCQKCPTFPWLVAQICLVVVIIVAVAVPVAMGKTVTNQNGRSLTDIMLARLKIVISFHQVTSGTLDAFAYIHWPVALMQMMNYAKFLQLNLLQIAPVNCVYSGINVTSYTSLVLFTSLVIAPPSLALAFYLLKKFYWHKMKTSDETLVLLSTLREKCYRVVFLLLFIIYPATCTQVLQILPSACHMICVDTSGESCQSFLRSDYSLKCNTTTYNKYVVISYCMLAFVVGYPVIILYLLWKYHYRAGLNDSKNYHRQRCNEISFGISFLYENYSENCWFWEVLELLRKVTLTSVLMLIGGQSRTQLGTAAIVSGLYTVLFAWYQPISEGFEHWLQLASLMGTSATVNMGMLLKIPQQKTSSGLTREEESVAVTVLLVLVNAMVTAIVIGQYCISFGSVVRKLRQTPQCDVECFLSVMLMLNEAGAEVGSMGTTNPLSRDLVPGGDIEAPGAQSAIEQITEMDVQGNEEASEQNMKNKKNSDQ